MSILGTVGSLYMSILVILLIIGFGLVGLKLVNYILTIDIVDTNKKNVGKIEESDKPETKKWLRLAFYSFLGLMVTVLVLVILSPGASASNHM